MQYTKLPHSSLEISKICLGTMTFGEQNSQADAFQQLDYALERGVNFIDTAEMYPVPPTAQTQGKTEEFIGNWLAKSGKREKIVLATKVAGHVMCLTFATKWRSIIAISIKRSMIATSSANGLYRPVSTSLAAASNQYFRPAQLPLSRQTRRSNAD